MTEKTYTITETLLRELRDAAKECYNFEYGWSKHADPKVLNYYQQLIDEANKLLKE
jgi:hypothetical protein